MRVRHLVEAANTEDDRVVDPTAVRHGTIRAGRVGAVAGQVDPETHLNADFPDHRVDACVVVEDLRVGAGVHRDGDGLVLAWVGSEAYVRLGHVDVGARRMAWLQRFGQGS